MVLTETFHATAGLLGLSRVDRPGDNEPTTIDELKDRLGKAERDAKRWHRKWEKCDDQLQVGKESLRTARSRELEMERHIRRLERREDEHREQATVWAETKQRYENAQAQEGDAKRRMSERQTVLERDLDVMRKELRETKRELTHLRAAHDNAKAMLATRTAELRDAQVYLSKTDNMSHADVQRAVEKLNSQIFQLSAFVVDKVTFSADRQHSPELQMSHEGAVQVLGENVANMLLSSSHVDDPMWVQMSLQAASSFCTTRIIEAWDTRFDLAKNSLLTDIHKEMFQSEPQAVSARWRALTRCYTKRMGASYGVPLDITRRIFEVLTQILQVSGAVHCHSAADWNDTFRAKITEIVAQSLKVQKALGEDVASSDFQIIHPAPNTPFSDDDMADVDDCGRNKGKKTQQPTPILFATELGLRRCEMQTREEDGAAECSIVTLLKAKVMLQDTNA